MVAEIIAGWVLQTRTIQTVTVVEYIGPIILSSGYVNPVTFAWQFDRYCQQSVAPSPGSPDWSTPVGSLYEGADTNVNVTYGGVTVPSGYIYQCHMDFLQFAQFDIVVVGGQPTITNFTMPAVETWIYTSGSGGQPAGETWIGTRTVRDYTEAELKHDVIPNPGGDS